MPKLSKRLAAIHAMIESGYDHIWDGCCDHGDLGMALLQSQPSSVVHFVDVVENIIRTLNDKLSCQYPDSSRWFTHCSDLNTLQLNHQDHKHLVIIAGVGGDLTAELVENLLQNNSQHQIDFILCPVRQHFRLRQAMKALGLKLIDETLIKERNLFYEIIHIGKSGEEIHNCGSRMWDLQQQAHCDYLEQKIQHYSQAMRSNHASKNLAFTAYQQLKRDHQGSNSAKASK